MNVLARLGRRHFVHHPLQSLLAILGIALGVAIVVAIDLANASASRAFDLSADSIAGRATHRIVGGPDGIDEQRYVELRRGIGAFQGIGAHEAAPVIEGIARRLRDGKRSETLTVLGVDPFAEAPLRPQFGAFAAGTSRFDLRALLTVPGAVVVTSDTAAILRVARGDTFDVETGGFRATLNVVDVIAPVDELVRAGLELVLLRIHRGDHQAFIDLAQVP